jgi:hypothetical protein
MKSVFEQTTRTELIQRINLLDDKKQAQWGKMNAYQMVRHCTLCEEMFTGKIKIKRVFIGRLLGKMVLKKALKNDAPFTKNSPTSPVLKTAGEQGDIEKQKMEWANYINGYGQFENTNFIHPFFGPMTREQIGFFVYKHADHHLRQFGV